MSLNASGKNIGVSAICILRASNWGVADLIQSIVLLIVVPDLTAGVVESHGAGRYLNDNISVVSDTLVCLRGEHRHEIVSEHLVADAGRSETVEFYWVREFKVAFEVQHGEGAQSRTKGVTCYQDG